MESVCCWVESVHLELKELAAKNIKQQQQPHCALILCAFGFTTGSQAVSPITHGGGSGQVTPGYVATPSFSLKNKLGFPQPKPTPNNCSDGDFDKGFDYRNTDSQTSAQSVSASVHVPFLAPPLMHRFPARLGCILRPQ